MQEWQTDPFLELSFESAPWLQSGSFEQREAVNADISNI